MLGLEIAGTILNIMTAIAKPVCSARVRFICNSHRSSNSDRMEVIIVPRVTFIIMKVMKLIAILLVIL